MKTLSYSVTQDDGFLAFYLGDVCSHKLGTNDLICHVDKKPHHYKILWYIGELQGKTQNFFPGFDRLNEFVTNTATKMKING